MYKIRILAGEQELMRASALIETVPFYGNVPWQHLQGTTMYGMFAADSLFACIMAVVQGPQAFINYLTVHPLMQDEGFATALVEYVRTSLYNKGVRDVHACVEGKNGASMRVCAKLSPLIGFPYTKLTFKLEEGDSHG